MSRKFLMSLMATVLLVAACGGAADGNGDAGATTIDQAQATTTPVAPTTTVSSTTTTPAVDDEGGAVGFGDVPQECIDAVVSLLRAIEPTVEAVDWGSADLTTLEEVANAIEGTYEEHESQIEALDCDDLNVDASDQESYDFLIGIAEAEAPGTVAYFEMIGELGMGPSEAVSGDCETDIAALQAIISEHGSIEHLAVADLTKVATLADSITTACSLERASEFFEQPDVAAFMED